MKRHLAPYQIRSKNIYCQECPIREICKNQTLVTCPLVKLLYPEKESE